MINRLYVFGNIGKLDQLPKSGGQSSARRVMKGFQEEGIEIFTIRRHRAEQQTKIGHKIEVAYFAVYDLLKMIIKLFFKRRRNAAFMQMTYAGALVPYEFILSSVAKIMGFRCIEYLQGGMMMDTYPRGSKLHKWMFKKNLELQEAVCFEGYDALKLVEFITRKPKLIYLPSYIRDELIPEACPKKPNDEINLCYFGRTSPVKNPIIIVDVFNELCSRHPDKVYNLIIVGSHHKKPYQVKLLQAIDDSPNHDRITRKENSPYSYLVEMMQKQHFYVFPTREKAEGHSNALNEAMSQGLIPVACDYHFNKSIIGDERFVVKGYNPKDYADKIDWIVDNFDLNELSQQMWKHVKDAFAYSKINHNVTEQIKSI